jgi:hypothetical protein
MKRFKGTAQDAIDFVLDWYTAANVSGFLRDWRSDDLVCDHYLYRWLEARYGKTMAELDEELGEEIG